MAFQLSPGVDVKEIDLTAIIPAVSTTKAGFAGLLIGVQSSKELQSPAKRTCREILYPRQ